MHTELRDPQATQRFIVVFGVMVLLIPILYLTQFNLLELFNPSNREVMGNFIRQFFPPRFNPEFMQLVFKATLETLAMATAGITLALILAIPLAFIISYSLSISRIGPARYSYRTDWLRHVARLMMLILRGVPELVWALLLVRVFGLGPIAGVLAIAITYAGMLAKVYAEILESNNTVFAKSLLVSGSNRTNAFLYGLLPECALELSSYTIYRWECAIRASVVMGFVGAGGLGQLMDQSMKMLNGGEVSSILLVFLLLVLLADYMSWLIRRRLS
jgi:phosphonate transport system permease protein